ncbi:MAG: LysR substrate-binding domain-containing protein [Runella sp.]
MNLQQLEYIVALDRHRHFVTAAEHCHVTQATLSMMIKKLEDEFEIKIFDRNKQPVVPTEIGQKIIAQAEIVLKETQRIKEIAQTEVAHIKGELRVGIIPTLAPYLLPLFLGKFLKNYPTVKLQVSELTTDVIIEKLKRNQLDAGLLAVPTHDANLVEIPLFREPFVVYSSPQVVHSPKKYLLPSDLDTDRLWLLEEGHCLRQQVINLCELKVHERAVHQFDLSASSIETLKKVVDMNEGLTILPYLSLKDLTEGQQKRVRFFKPPVPFREIGLVCFRYFSKEKIVQALKNEILRSLPNDLTTAQSLDRVH